MLDAATELLYVGKATSLRRRLRQHAGAKPGAGGPRLDLLYERTVEVRWQEMPDEHAAFVRETDLIAALQPICNASSRLDRGTWNYLTVRTGRRDGVLRFELTRSRIFEDQSNPKRPDRAYGCFPHLGRGVGTPPGIACSDGYVALLRLLWAATASRDDRVPSRITRAAPDEFEVTVQDLLRPALHSFLSGTSRRLLDRLASAYEQMPDPTRRSLIRDLPLAEAFYVHGPRALRELRLRYRKPAGPMSRALLEELLTIDLRNAIGDFRVPDRPHDVGWTLGRDSRR